MKNKIKKVICRNCREDFIQKRRNQVYCHPGCRIEFNNEKNNERRIVLNKRQKPLARNYDILSELLGNLNEKEVHVEYLRGAKYDLSLFTHFTDIDEEGNLCYGVHEFSIRQLPNKNYFKITRNDRH